MDANNSKPSQGSPNIATNSWKTQDTQALRQKTASHIVNVLKQHFPINDLTPIKNIALRLEQKMFTAATSQEDYIQKISRKLSSINVADKNDPLHSLPSVPSSTHMKQQPVVPMQQQAAQTMPASSPTHGRQSQPEPNVHKFVSQAQSPPANFLENPHPIHEEIKQAVPMSDSLLEAQQLKLQRKQLLQSKNTFPAQSANLKLEQGQVDEDTWREEIYQWLQTLKKLFLPELRQFCYKVDSSLRQIASDPQRQMTAVIKKQYELLHCIKQFIVLLEIAKHKIEPKYQRHIAKLEKDLIHFFKLQELKRSMSSQHDKQLPLPKMNAFQQSSPRPHNQNPLHSDTNMLQSVHLKQQGIPKSHLGEQEMGNTRNPMQHHFSRQQQVKLEPPSPVTSPQLLQVASIQPSQNPLPGNKQKNLQTSAEITGTSAGVQQASGAGLAAATSLQITTPGLSASPLFESSNTTKDNNPTNMSEFNPQESSVIEQPIQRLLRVVNSTSSATLGASVEALESLVGSVERIPGSLPDKAYKPVVDEHLVAMTEYYFKKIYSPTAFLMRGVSSDSSISEMESVATFHERTMIKENSLLEEIRKINRRLINTVVEICDENDNATIATSFTEDSQARIVKCSFIDLATKNFISAHASENLLLIQPLKLLIPGTYPVHSPLVLDKSSALPRDGDGASSMKNEEDLTGKAISKLKLYLRRFEQALSLEKIAKAWEACAHSVFCEYAEQYGGGSFSSKYGAWEKCASAS